jgi:apolipoprotein N-acyltransferase
MRRLVQTLRRHPLATAIFTVLWLATWLVTILTWERDAAGRSVGMHRVAIPLHFVLPLVLGTVLALAAPGDRAPVRRCVLGGIIFGIVEFVILALFDALWLPAPEPPTPVGELVIGTAAGAVLYAVACAVLSALAGGLATRLHHGGDARRPPATAPSR